MTAKPKPTAAIFESIMGDVKTLQHPPWMTPEEFACALTENTQVPWRVAGACS